MALCEVRAKRKPINPELVFHREKHRESVERDRDRDVTQINPSDIKKAWNDRAPSQRFSQAPHSYPTQPGPHRFVSRETAGGYAGIGGGKGGAHSPIPKFFSKSYTSLKRIGE